MGAVKLTNLSRLFRHFADMIDNGYCDNITEDDIDAMTEVLKPYLNVKVNYEQAGAVSFPCLPTRQNGTAKRL